MGFDLASFNDPSRSQQDHIFPSYLVKFLVEKVRSGKSLHHLGVAGNFERRCVGGNKF